MIYALPYPPSVNMYWRHTKAGRHYISKEGQSFRELVMWIVAQGGRIKPLTTKLSVDVQISPPDNRRRDLDNTLKTLLDALEHAGVYENDYQIDRLCVSRCAIDKPAGNCVVKIEEINSGG